MKPGKGVTHRPPEVDDGRPIPPEVAKLLKVALGKAQQMRGLGSINKQGVFGYGHCSLQQTLGARELGQETNPS
jgi:hypothetical protein